MTSIPSSDATLPSSRLSPKFSGVRLMVSPTGDPESITVHRPILRDEFRGFIKRLQKQPDALLSVGALEISNGKKTQAIQGCREAVRKAEMDIDNPDLFRLRLARLLEAMVPNISWMGGPFIWPMGLQREAKNIRKIDPPPAAEYNERTFTLNLRA